MCLFLNDVLIIANSANPNEMQHYAAFHLGLHCRCCISIESSMFVKVAVKGFPVYDGLIHLLVMIVRNVCVFRLTLYHIKLGCI